MSHQEKLFSINKNDRLIVSTEILHVKDALNIIENLQAKGQVYETWKLDIFIDMNAVGLIIKPIPISAWYKKGVYEHAIYVMKNNGSTGEHTISLARFATREEALRHVPYVQAFILHRYDMDIKFNEKYIQTKE